jgi:hypothetical protein
MGMRLGTFFEANIPLESAELLNLSNWSFPWIGLPCVRREHRHQIKQKGIGVGAAPAQADA